MATLHGVLGHSRRGIAGLIAAAVIAAVSVALATDQPDQLITGKKLLVKTSTDTTKNKVVFISKDDSFVLPDAGNDPTMEGATLTVVDLGGGAGTMTANLASTRWQALPTGFKYKGQTGDPCKTIIIKDDKLVKVVCKGASVTLTPPFTGAAAVALEVGSTSIRYCASFVGMSVVLKNELKPNGKGIFKGKGAPAPASCPDCGDGDLDAGEQCDDSNNANGDCCSATCQFETSGSACDDGDACTENDQCDGAGVCGADPVCGNNVLNGACGEQCDGTDDAACEDSCLPDCTCPAEPTCVGDSGRTLYAGGPNSNGCPQYDGNQTVCDTAFFLDNGGVTSCWYDSDNDECLACTPDDQADGLCMNECRPVACAGDPGRTFTGGPGTPGCQNFGLPAGTANCQLAFEIGNNGVQSCYYDVGIDECVGCDADAQEVDDCVNACAACQSDPARTIFAGGPGTQACHQFDGDEASCNQAFHRDQCGNDVSCFYDGFDCNGCGPNNQQDGACVNTCQAGPVTCTNDPSRTIDAGGPQSSACHQFDGDPASCQQAFHKSECLNPTSCWYDFANDECRGCGPNNERDGACVNTCVAGAITCPADPSRTLLAGMPGYQGCQELGLSAGTAACQTAFNVGSGGVTSCYTDGFGCQGCGPPNEGNGDCRNTCVSGPPACPDDPTRTTYAGGPNTQACTQFDGNQAACEAAFHTGQCGETSCYWDSGNCLGCGPNNQVNGNCTNTCQDPTCSADVTRTIYAGGPGTSACHTFDGDQTNCEKAYHLGQSGSGTVVASCYYDIGDDECRGCGPNNQGSGNCVNTCAVCAADSARDIAPMLECAEFDGNQAGCENAFQIDDCGRSVSCYYRSGSCLDCGPDNFSSDNCSNTCVTGPVVCENDASRTIFAGHEDDGGCEQYVSDPVSCLKAFQQGANGGVTSCYYDSGSGDCYGCEQGSFECLNTCLNGAPPCTEDPGRTIYAGLPQTQACHAFDGNQAGCEDAYHLDECFRPASCWYDTDLDECLGCGPNNEQSGFCTNTCKSGPASCDLDPSRTNYGGGPMSGACSAIDSQSECLATFHTGQCGVASCYWDGFGCSGCGPNNEFDAQCFNTCEAP